MMRFRIKAGKVMVIPPGEPHRWEQVNLVYDHANDMFGVQPLGGDLQGYVFFVSQSALKHCRDTGEETDTLKAV